MTFWYLANITQKSNSIHVQLNNEVGISVIHFNARSLNWNFYKIMGCIHALKCSFDIIAITEIWADQTNSTSDYNMPGYNVFNTIRINKKGGSVALNIRHIRKQVKLLLLLILHVFLYKCCPVKGVNVNTIRT